MATNTSEIRVSELDFDLIKQNLITYFKSDPTFQDYEFEGSALNILMDILSYNTHMNSVIANMSANEMFIDSAQLRQSVVSLAKMLGYTPRSKRTAVASIDIAFTGVTGFPAYITMPAGTRFATPDGIIFSTKEQILIYPTEGGSTGDYSITDVAIYEGYFNAFTYTVDYTNPDQTFDIPTADADTSSLVVINKTGNTLTEFAYNSNLATANESSTIYFLHEKPEGYFEVQFGDGIIGRRPVNGSQVILSYIISKYGKMANNSSVFLKNQLIDGLNNYTVTTNTIAYGADDPETVKSIQTKAPAFYKSQYRAVVTEDYENFMLAEYPWIESMSVWGGEYNEPPVYGKVFIAIKPSHTTVLANSLKDKIKTDLISKYNVVTVIPEIVDPDYVYLLPTTHVEYSAASTILTADELITKVKDSIIAYFIDNTQLFNKPFYFSKMTTAIDASDASIANSVTTIMMMKRFYPLIGANESREIKFGNAISPGGVISSYFNLSGITGQTAKQYFKDNGKGNLYTVNVITNEVIDTSIGSVNYETGVMDININVFEVPPDTLDLRVYAKPANPNITPGFNQIILLDDSPIQQDYGRKQGVTITATAENKDYK